MTHATDQSTELSWEAIAWGVVVSLLAAPVLAVFWLAATIALFLFASPGDVGLYDPSPWWQQMLAGALALVLLVFDIRLGVGAAHRSHEARVGVEAG